MHKRMQAWKHKSIQLFLDQMSEGGINVSIVNLSDFDHGMIVGARQGGLSI